MPSTPPDSLLAPYDAIVVLSFGGPENADEVLPFLRRVTAGRDVPEERLVEVAAHYDRFGGRSPINDQNRALIERLDSALRDRGIAVPVVLGNRNSAPFLVDTLTELLDVGHARLLVVTTSAYSSYSGCRQYRENLAEALTLAQERTGSTAVVDKVRPYAGHPGFVAAQVARLTEAVQAGADLRNGQLLWVTHSIPESMALTSGPGDADADLYVDQHQRLAAAIERAASQELGIAVEGELVFCSRSGPPQQPWLEPDVVHRIQELAAQGVASVTVVPIGFISDHMEVISDLDLDAVDAGRAAGIPVVRVRTVGTHPAFVEGLVDLLLERAAQARGVPVMPADAIGGDLRPAVCDAGCCPNLRVALPALCGKD
ncbi:MAG: ferrochelatase [Phycicoccus sp.]|nr:ferrochelatase [Phycicoccus sp.]